MENFVKCNINRKNLTKEMKNKKETSMELINYMRKPQSEWYYASHVDHVFLFKRLWGLENFPRLM